MVKSTISRKWRGQDLKKDEVIEGTTPKQEAAMVACGQAYYVDKPTMDFTKDEIQSWMKDNGYEFTTDMTKQELIDSIG